MTLPMVFFFFSLTIFSHPNITFHKKISSIARGSTIIIKKFFFFKLIKALEHYYSYYIYYNIIIIYLFKLILIVTSRPDWSLQLNRST